MRFPVIVLLAALALPALPARAQEAHISNGLACVSVSTDARSLIVENGCPKFIVITNAQFAIDGADLRSILPTKIDVGGRKIMLTADSPQQVKAGATAKIFPPPWFFEKRSPPYAADFKVILSDGGKAEEVSGQVSGLSP